MRLGVTNLRETGLDVPIKNFIRHEDYDRNTKQNDIAVVELSRNIPFSNPKRIRPGCLWSTLAIDQTRTIASGWGNTAYAGSGSDELMKVRLDILDQSLCVKTFEDDDDIVINENQICAGILSGDRDTCQGSILFFLLIKNSYKFLFRRSKPNCATD